MVFTFKNDKTMSYHQHLSGKQGADTIEDTNTHTAGAGNHTDVVGWCPVFVVAATTFTSNTAVLTGSGDAGSTSAEYAAGSWIYRPFTAIDIAAGGVIDAYRVKDWNDLDNPRTRY